MKISFSFKKTGAGFALLTTMCFLAVALLVFSSVMYWIMSNSTQTRRNNMYTTSEAAAEGATEKVFTAMDRDYLDHALNGAGAYTGLIPDTTNWPIQFVFSDTNGITGQVSVNVGDPSGTLQPLGSQFSGLQGYPQLCTVTATATPQNQLYDVPATVSQTFNFASVPAFQFAIFYNLNLEIDPGANMPIQGPVFSNQGIWSGTPNLTYASIVEAVGQVNTSGTDPFVSGKTDSGTPNSNFQLSYESGVNPLIIPIGADNTNNSATNVEAIINIPPPGVCAPQPVAYTSTNQTYDFNAATLIVSNWYNGTNVLDGSYTPHGNNFTVYLQDNSTYLTALPYNWTQLTNDYYVVTNSKTATVYRTNTLSGLPGFVSADLPSFPWTQNTHISWPSGTTNYGVMYAGFSFLTNVAFYDYRESDTAQAVQIDVAALRRWITNSAPNGGSGWNLALCKDTGQGISSIFVYNGVPLTSSQLPAVRLVNGQRLPNSTNNNVYYNGTNSNITTSGLTVVTPQPLYVLGNYNVQIDGDGNNTPSAGTHNTSHTYPAAFLADAITVLSGNWSDTNTPSTSYSLRTPTTTTINAACLEGIVPSNNNYPHTGGATGYSGGVENFLRLLENWSGINLWYNGSIMVMFPSQYATNFWQNTGNYYNAPARNWAFDTNFLQQSKLPALTPQFRAVVRDQWAGR